MSIVIDEVVSQSNEEVKSEMIKLRELASSNMKSSLMDAVGLAGKLIRRHEVLGDPEFCSVFYELTGRFFSRSLKGVLIDMYAYDCTSPNYKGILAVMGMWLEDVREEVREITVMILSEFAIASISTFPASLLLKAIDRFDNDEVVGNTQPVTNLLSQRGTCDLLSNRDLRSSGYIFAFRTIVYIMENGCSGYFSFDRVVTSGLFPKFICAEERADHWAYFFHLFSSSQRQKLEDYLCDKHRFQLEVKEFLKHVLQKDPADGIQSCTSSSIRQFFQTLCQLKDNVFGYLHQLLDERSTIKSSKSARKAIMRMITLSDPSFMYLDCQIMKCSYSIFTHEYVGRLIILLNGDVQSAVDPHHALELLLMIIKVFPVLGKVYKKDLVKTLCNNLRE